MAALIRLSNLDNVAIATQTIAPNQNVNVGDLVISPPVAIQRGHKMALQQIPSGQPIIKYGQPIGLASKEIAAGDHVHTHNVDHHFEVADDLGIVSPPDSPPRLERTFEGFHRPDGRVGTRNFVVVMSTVNCSATVCHKVAERFDEQRMKQWPNVDGVFAATHTTGCAIEYHGVKHQMLGRTMSGFANHPNVGGTLVVGLGCEQNTPGYLSEHHGVVSLYAPSGEKLTRDDGIPMLTMQSEGGTRATINKAEQLLVEVLDRANRFTRQTAGASHLMLAVECGGSDGYSGLTANPAVGVVSDRVVACGGTSIISETTELCGAENLLIARSRSKRVAQKLLDRINWWKEYVGMYGGTIDNNPSVGNKAGGLTTIVEKSLGAVAKSGSTALEEVYQYAERVESKGLVVMDTPGFDPASVTGKVAGGANIVMFTTGRGSCFGCKPAPVIKIATNTPMFNSMREDMDLNAGTVIDGDNLQRVGDEFFEYLLKVASGEKTSSELLDMGDHEFVPWTVGPVV